MDTIKQPRMSRAYQVLSITAIATFLVSLDTSIVVVARRAIAEDRLEKLISRSYQEGEKEERITILINLVLDVNRHRFPGHKTKVN